MLKIALKREKELGLIMLLDLISFKTKGDAKSLWDYVETLETIKKHLNQAEEQAATMNAEEERLGWTTTNFKQVPKTKKVRNVCVCV